MTLNIKLDNKQLNETEPKKKAKKSRNKLKIFLVIFLTMVIFAIGGMFIYSHMSNKWDIGFSPLSPFSAPPELRKDSTGTYTNVLVVGIDTRDSNPGLKNTDTIILLSYNHKTQKNLLVSIPRDFFVEVPEQGWYTKINGIYNVAENRQPGTGLETLQSVVENITNTEIQYYAMVNLASFTELIDTLGGVEVDVENPFTDYRYPVEGQEHRHQVISFEEGPQIMDGETALRFVRSRHSPHYGEGSDFARARRQQRILTGIKNELLSSENLLNPVKLWDVLSILEKNIEHTRITNKDIQAVINILKNEDINTYSFVLDPSLANYQLITDKGLTYDAYAVGPLAGLNNYVQIHQYLEHAFQKPEIYSQNPAILTYDVGIGYNEANLKTQEMKEKLPYINIIFSGTLLTGQQQNYIFTNSQDEDTDIKSILAKILEIENVEKPEFATEMNLNGEYIVFLGQENINQISYITHD